MTEVTSTPEDTMGVNAGKVVTGGAAAGVVLIVLDYLVNGRLLAEQNRAAVSALNPALVETMEGGGAMALYIVIDLVFGLLLVWTYAAMRPRFGAGPKTAVIAGVQIWGVAFLMYLSMTAMGMWTWSYFALGAAVSLIMLVVAATVGAKLYKEG